MGLEARYQFGLSLVREAGALALSYFNARDKLTIQHKGVQDLASEADLNTELLIKQRISETFPKDAFLGEETGPTTYAEGQGIWVVDPIDGTQPFICGLSCWCVSIAFVQNGELQFGMVYAPSRDELFAGGAGHKATLNGEVIHGSSAKSVRDGLISAGYSPKAGPDMFLPVFTQLLDEGGMFFREGSGALAICYVANGRLIGFFEAVIRSWDCLGALAVAQAAGLRFNPFLNGQGLFKGNPLIVGNAAIYAALNRIVDEKGKGLWGPLD
ncbi:MAG: inositol monophosphatase [Alphaproteobacteria bacterium]|nr:inositol monophosphatase [Alphaproteobacteria bacterium]